MFSVSLSEYLNMKIRKIKRNRIDITTYFMPPETKKVAVEYLLYDLIGVIGAVGGTMGLFIGFSMFGKNCFLSLNQLTTQFKGNFCQK